MALQAKQYGVIDVGSNSVRLSVYTPSEGAYPLRKVFDEKQAVGLAAYVSQGVLSDAGIRAAAKAVKRQIVHANLVGCDSLCVFATAALRNCENSQEAVKLFSQMIGNPVDLVSGRREAELGFAGMRPEIKVQTGWIVDIGGGSTELSMARDGAIAATKSSSFGSLSLWHAYVAGLVPTQTEFESCRQHVRSTLAQLDYRAYVPEGASEGAPCSTLYGIGGTIRSAAKLWAAYETLNRGNGESVEVPEYVSLEQVQELADFALRSPGEYGHLIARIEPTRIHTTASGLAILLELFDWTGAQQVRRSKHGIREGYVLSCMM